MIIHFKTIIIYKQSADCVTERTTLPTTIMCLRFYYPRLLFGMFVVCISGKYFLLVALTCSHYSFRLHTNPVVI